MAQSQSGFDMEAYKNDLDAMMATVMPDSWLGHGRMKIHSRGFDPKARKFSEKLLARMAEKHPDADTEKLAEKVIETTEKKLD